jgi:membrane protein YdbS with pleckstrin-like domain
MCHAGAVGVSTRLLGADEYVVMHLRTHGKVLFWPALGLIAVGGLIGIGTALIPSAFRPGGQIAVALLGLALAIWWAIIPYLRWSTNTYTLTNRRLITRWGILNRAGKDFPLTRVNDVAYEQSMADRMLGCGTLYVQSAAEGGPIVLVDVPDVADVHVTMSELLHGRRR